MKKNKNVQFVDSILQHLDTKRNKAHKNSVFKLYLLKYGVLAFYLFFIKGSILVKLLIGLLYWVLITVFCDHRDITVFSPSIRVWFGVPGSGKTSMAAWLTKNSLKSGYKVLSNVEIEGAYKLEPEDLGKYDMSFDGEGAHVVYDEGSLDFDNRNHKEFAKSTKPQYFALHRHMLNRVDVFSQGYDIDKRIRDRAGSAGLFYLKRIPLKGFVCYRKIKKVLFIKKEDKQMIDGFEFRGLPRICYTKSVWHTFDTLDMSLCPKLQKDWQLWEVSHQIEN